MLDDIIGILLLDHYSKQNGHQGKTSRYFAECRARRERYRAGRELSKERIARKMVKMNTVSMQRRGKPVFTEEKLGCVLGKKDAARIKKRMDRYM